MRIKLEMKPLAAPPLFEKQRINKETSIARLVRIKEVNLSEKIESEMRSRPSPKLCLHACAARK